MPAWLKNAPMLWPSLTPFYAAYCELTTCRPSGFGPVPIPWTAIMDYCDRAGLDSQDRRDLLYLIRFMDRAFLEYSSNEAKKKSKPAGPDGGRRKIGG